MTDEKLSDRELGEERSLKSYNGENYYMMNTNGKYLHKMDLGTFIAPKYALCNTCPFAPKNGGQCEDYKDNADCIVERAYYDIFMQSMAEQGVTDEDRLIIYPLQQQFFRLNRLYALELGVDLRAIYDFDPETGKNPTLDVYKELLRMIESNEKGMIQKLKELLATRKERNTKRGRKNTQSLSDLLANLKVVD